MKKIVLVLGSTGLIGHQVFNYLNNTEKYEMFNLAYRKKLNDETILCNVRSEKKFIDIIKSINPDIIINCIGILIKGANRNAENAIFINSYIPHLLMNLLDKINSKLIHLSTDCVFSGDKGKPYLEKDHKDGKDTYAKTKGLGEIINTKHLTLRTSVIGPELKPDGEELFQWFMSQSGEIKGYTKVLWSGVSSLILAKVIFWAIESRTTGLYHVTNNKSIDKFTLLTLMKKYTKKNILIHPFDEKELNKSFIDTRKELNFVIPTYDEMVKDMIFQAKNDKSIYSHYNFHYNY